MKKFILAMDNYFTLPRAIKRFRNHGIGIIGTSRFRAGWLSAKLRGIDVKSVNFNDFYWEVDQFGTLVGRWMENGLVLMVSTVHKIGKIVIG